MTIVEDIVGSKPGAVYKTGHAVQFLVLFALKNWFIIGMGVVILLAYLFPNVARAHGILRSDIAFSYCAVAIIFLISGLSMPTKVMAKQAKHWRAHIVTQGLSFVITPAVMFGFVVAIHKSGNKNMDPWVLVGMIIAGTTPTTVASNVLMTRMCNGNESLALLEVTVGNLLGSFISPGLIQLYLSKHTGFAYGNPANHLSIRELYAKVMKQVGLSLFVPLFVGQVVQNVFPKQVKWAVTHLYLAKVGTLMLLLLIWSTFSTAFYDKAFEEVHYTTMVMVCFFNVGAYLLFTLLCLGASRLPVNHLPKPTDKSGKFYTWFYKMVRPFHFSRKDTCAIMLCGAAKTVALGAPMISAQYGSQSPVIGKVSIPLTLYQGEQILVAQFLVPVLKRWVAGEEDIPKPEDIEAPATTSGSSGEDDGHEHTKAERRATRDSSVQPEVPGNEK